MVLLIPSQDPTCLDNKIRSSSAYTNYHNSCHSESEDLLENVCSDDSSRYASQESHNQCSRYQMLEIWRVPDVGISPKTWIISHQSWWTRINSSNWCPLLFFTLYLNESTTSWLQDDSAAQKFEKKKKWIGEEKEKLGFERKWEEGEYLCRVSLCLQTKVYLIFFLCNCFFTKIRYLPFISRDCLHTKQSLTNLTRLKTQNESKS